MRIYLRLQVPGFCDGGACLFNLGERRFRHESAENQHTDDCQDDAGDGITFNDIDFFEYHDAYSIYAALALESSGFAIRGHGWKMAADGRILARSLVERGDDPDRSNARKLSVPIYSPDVEIRCAHADDFPSESLEGERCLCGMGFRCDPVPREYCDGQH